MEYEQNVLLGEETQKKPKDQSDMVRVEAKFSIRQEGTSKPKKEKDENSKAGTDVVLKSKNLEDFIAAEINSSKTHMGWVTPETEEGLSSVTTISHPAKDDFLEKEKKQSSVAKQGEPQDKEGRTPSKDKPKKKVTSTPKGSPLKKSIKSFGYEEPEEEKSHNKKIDIDAEITIDPNDPTDEKLIMHQIIIREGKPTQPEDEDLKVFVNVQVKPGDTSTQAFLEDNRKLKILSRYSLEPGEFNNCLKKASSSGKDRVIKMHNLKKQPHLITWMVPSRDETERVTSEDISKELNELSEAISKGKDPETVRKIFIYIIEHIDIWLETVEYRILVNRSGGEPNRDKINQLNLIKEDVDTVKNKLLIFLKNINKTPSMSDSDILRHLKIYIEELEPQISEIQEVTKLEKENAVKDLSRWEEFLNGVNNVSVIVEELKQHLDKVLESDGSARNKLEELEKIDGCNKEYMEKAFRLIALAKDVANYFPNQEIPPETYTTYEVTKIIQNNVYAERERLLQLLSLAEEYEQTLKEFAQIVEVADNLVESPITITSLQHLQDEMQKHRKFFVNLSHCRAILESLESNLDKETRGAHNHLHGKLHAKASSILDKAASRAQQMAMAASKWTILDKGVRKEQQWLQVAHQRIPDLQQVRSTDYDRYISLYQSLASDTAVHHAKILQLIDVANKLQDIVTCVGLERFYEDYLNVILKLQEEIDCSLEKLMVFQVIKNINNQKII